MTKAEIEKKIEAFIALGNELDAEAKRRYGRSGSLFTEADGGVYLMDGDCNGSAPERQKHIRFRAQKGIALWGAGAW